MRIKKKRFVKIAFVLAFLHFILAFCFFLISFDAGNKRFENLEYKITWVQKLMEPLVDILWQPALFLYDKWKSQNTPNIVEWLMLIGNSFLWGFLLTFLVYIPVSIRRRKQEIT